MPQVQDTLSARRKADRGDMAQQVIDLASEYGLTVTAFPEQAGSRRASVSVGSITYGLRVAVKFDGQAADPDIYVLSWFGVKDGWRLHPGMFGNVNSFHGHKATDVARGFAQLLRILRERFTVIADGSAFITATVPGTGSTIKAEEAGGSLIIVAHTRHLDIA